MLSCMHDSSLAALRIATTSIALSRVQSACAIPAAQSSATTETIVLSPPFVPTMQSYAMGRTDDQIPQIVAAQLRLLNLIEQMDRKVALLATSKKSAAE
jgi:hypothetical protein